MTPNCYSCIHLMPPEKTADGNRLCRTYGLAVSPELEADCKRHVREPGSDDAIPAWYWPDQHAAGEGRGD